MSAYDELERQLRGSVARYGGRRPVAGWRSHGPVLFVAAGSAVALGVLVIALVALGHGGGGPAPLLPATPPHRSRFGPRPKDPGPIPRDVDDAVVAAGWNTASAKDRACNSIPRRSAGSGVSEGTPSAAMLSTIPIFERPATPADRLPAFLSGNVGFRSGIFQFGRPYIRFVRVARVADGTTFYLVPAAGVGRPPLSPAIANHCYALEVAALQASLPTVPASERAPTRRYGDAEYALGRYNLETSSVHEGVFLFATRGNGGGGGGGAESASAIRQTGLLSGGGGGTPPTPILMYGIVPPGVATVTLHFTATHYRGERLPALDATGNVVNNVFVMPVPTLFERGAWPTAEVWRSSTGKMIKTVNERPFHP